MATPLNVNPVELPPPVGGLDALSPLADMDPLNSPWMVNVDCEPNHVAVRPGYLLHCDLNLGGSSARGLGVHGSGSGQKLFSYVYDGSSTNKIYDVSSGTKSLSHTLVNALNGTAWAVNFHSKLVFLTGSDWANTSAIYNGSAWSAWAFTYLGASVGGPVGLGFKRRFYFFIGTGMYYAALDAVSGACSFRDLATVFKSSGFILWAATLASPGDRPEELYMCIGNQSGEILVYAGDYPDDPNWRLIGQFKAGLPLGYNSAVEAYNDVIVQTNTGFVSVRSLFAQGSIATSATTISQKINPILRKILRSTGVPFSASPGGRYSGCLWPEKNRIVFLGQGHYDLPTDTLSNNNTLYHYNIETQSWSIHKPSGVSLVGDHIVNFNGEIYYTYLDYIVKLPYAGIQFRDQNVAASSTYNPYDWAIWGAYNSYGSSISNKRVVGFEPTFQSNLTSTTFGMKAASDFGRQVSGQEIVSLQTGYNSPYYSVGAEGSYIHYRLEGTANQNITPQEIGLELYSVGSILEAGGIR